MFSGCSVVQHAWAIRGRLEQLNFSTIGLLLAAVGLLIICGHVRHFGTISLQRLPLSCQLRWRRLIEVNLS